MRMLSVCLTLVAIVPVAPSEEVIALESGALGIRWDAARGTLVSLKDRSSGREWLDSSAVRPLYTIKFADQTPTITSTSAKSVSVRKDRDAVIVEGAHEVPEGLTVTCRFWPEANSSHILAGISIRSRVPRSFAEVRFPQLPLRLPFSGSGENDRLIWPECDGTVLLDPGKNRAEREFKYPGVASVQMMAAFDPGAGVYMAARDRLAHTKMFCSHRSGKTLELSIAHLVPQSPALQWESGYDVDLAAMRPSAGIGHITWEAAADLYREWAIGQPWCKRTMAQRVASGDVPKWMTEPTLILTYSLRGQRPDGIIGDRRSFLADQADLWREVVGAPITCLIISWEKHDTWVTPDYFPPFGGESEFAALTKDLHGRGHRTMVFLSGLHWTLRKDLAGPDRPRVLVDQRAEFEQRGRASAISDAKGDAIIVGKPTEGVGEHATICSSTPLAREILAGTSSRCGQLGIDCVQVDQIVGGGMKECLHPRHDHPPGGGGWCGSALYRLFDEIRKEGKARHKDFAFSIEEPGEFYLPILDTYHARDLHQGRWPRSGAGVLGVPLFTHIYHDYLPGYGSEGCYVSDKPSRLVLYQIGMNLVCGKIPAVALWGRWLDPKKLEMKQRRLLRAHIDLWRGPAGEFLNFGRRVASPALDVPSMEMTIAERDGKTRRGLTLPTVLHATWQLADGRSGTVFACVGDEPVTFDFHGSRLTLESGQAEFRPGP